MIIIFTLDGCPACDELKRTLKQNGLEYIDIEINEYPNVWEEVVNVTKEDSVPTILLKQTVDDNMNTEEKKSNIYVAGVDFNNINEAIKIIENYFSNKGA